MFNRRAALLLLLLARRKASSICSFSISSFLRLILKLLITDYSAMNVATAKPILENLAKRYTLLLVSNYYGNVAKVIEDMQIAHLFVSVTDSAVESIRKPDARLWQIAIERQGFKPEDVLIVGDSKKNDILPGLAIGAQVVQGVPADVELPKEYQAIKHLDELKGLLS